MVSSERTSEIRWADSIDIVTITKIIETIIRLIRIWIEYVIIPESVPTLTLAPLVEIAIFEQKNEMSIIIT